MSRPRSKPSKLPQCLYFKHGRYWFVKKGKWTDFGTTLHGALKLYADAHKERGVGGMEKLLSDYLSACTKTCKESTLSNYRAAINNQITPVFVEFQPNEVRAQDIAAFLYHHEAHPNMANQLRQILKGAFALAIKQGIAESNPVIFTERNVEKKRKRYLTDAEFMAIRSAGDATLKIIMDISFFTAQRIGDVLKIRRADIRPTGHLYVKQQKTDKEILIVITPELRRALDAARGDGNVRSMFLISQSNGKRWSYYAINNRWNAASALAGIEDTRIHDVRAKSITEATKQGLDAKTLAGHTKQVMTDRYIRDKELDVATPPSFRQLA